MTTTGTANDGRTVPDGFRDLLAAPFATLATNGASGCPQLTAVAFLHDEDDDLIKISLNDTRQKTRNMRRDPHATLFVVDPQNPGRTLEVRADVEFAPDPDCAFCARAGAKYGQDFRANDRPGETRSIVTLRPRRVVGTDLSG